MPQDLFMIGSHSSSQNEDNIWFLLHLNIIRENVSHHFGIFAISFLKCAPNNNANAKNLYISMKTTKTQFEISISVNRKDELITVNLNKINESKNIHSAWLAYFIGSNGWSSLRQTHAVYHFFLYLNRVINSVL